MENILTMIYQYKDKLGPTSSRNGIGSGGSISGL